MSMKRNKKTLWLYGKHAVSAALANPAREIHRVVATRNAANTLKTTHKIDQLDGDAIAKLLPQGAVHQGVACETSPLPEMALEELGDASFIIALDQVSDPHNVGAIVRSAAAFGVDAVLVTDRCAPQETGVMAKSASGGLEIVPIIPVINLARAMEDLKAQGFWSIGLDGHSNTTIEQVPDYDKTLLVMGAEGKGLRKNTAQHCDLLVKLPMSDRMESLNVSNAASIAMYTLYNK